MTLVELKDLAIIFQSLAVAVAVLVGGGWTLFRYFSLRSIQHAQADLEKTRVEIEGARRTLQERGIIEIALEAEQMFLGNDYLICVYVKLKNTGSCTEIIDWKKSFVTAEKVICESDGSVGFPWDSILGERPKGIADSVLASGETGNHSFIIRVPDSGIYYETAEKGYLEAPSPEWAIKFPLTAQTETLQAAFSFNSTHFPLLFIPFSTRCYS